MSTDTQWREWKALLLSLFVFLFQNTSWIDQTSIHPTAVSTNDALRTVWGYRVYMVTCTQRSHSRLPQYERSHEDYCAVTKVFSNVLAVPIIILTIMIIRKKNQSPLPCCIFCFLFFLCDYQQVLFCQSYVKVFGKTLLRCHKEHNR